MSTSPMIIEDRDETIRALHAVLSEHPGGLALAEISLALGLPPDTTDAILDEGVRADLIEMHGHEEGRVLYSTTRRIKPESSARSALDALKLVREKRRNSTQTKRWIMVLLMATMAVSAAVVLLRRSISHDALTATDLSYQQTSPSEEQVAALVAADRRKQWTSELEDLENRINRLDADAASANCTPKWASGDQCYVSNRLLSKTAFDEERARTSLRVAELRHLIESSR